MTRFHLSDYPRFRAAIMAHRDSLTMRSRDFEQFLKQEFDIDAEVHAGDFWGAFWLNEEQAAWFLLKWS